ncbi:MAG: hypothetical protein Q8880_09230 [Bacteroidota bacterium]|nr:hypothetical protein [Bacteroidota bacterium]
MDNFALLDDCDMLSGIKTWCKHEDRMLSMLSNRLINRNLFRIEIKNEPFEEDYINQKRETARKKYSLKDDEIHYLVFTDIIKNNAYDSELDRINILYRDEETIDIALASDCLNISVLSKEVQKHFICYPKDI